MFATTGLALTFIAIELLAGFVIGLITVALIYRSRLRAGLVIRGILFAGLAFLIMSGVAGWADSHAAFQDGHRLDIAPWGEDLRLRNFIAENGPVLCISGSVIAAALSGVHLQKAKQN
jgi:hypothetical protein